MSESERPEDPSEEPNESAWNKEAVEGQIEELEDQADEDEPGEDAGPEGHPAS